MKEPQPSPWEQYRRSLDAILKAYHGDLPSKDRGMILREIVSRGVVLKNSVDGMQNAITKGVFSDEKTPHARAMLHVYRLQYGGYLTAIGAMYGEAAQHALTEMIAIWTGTSAPPTPGASIVDLANTSED